MRYGLAEGEELAWVLAAEAAAEKVGQTLALAVVRESEEVWVTAQQYRMLKAVEIRVQFQSASTGAQCRANGVMRGDGVESERAEPRDKGQCGPLLA